MGAGYNVGSVDQNKFSHQINQPKKGISKFLKKNKAKRFAKQQRSNVDIALASFYCYCLRATKAVGEEKSYSGELLTAADRCKNNVIDQF